MQAVPPFVLLPVIDVALWAPGFRRPHHRPRPRQRQEQHHHHWAGAGGHETQAGSRARTHATAVAIQHARARRLPPEPPRYAHGTRGLPPSPSRRARAPSTIPAVPAPRHRGFTSTVRAPAPTTDRRIVKSKSGGGPCARCPRVPAPPYSTVVALLPASAAVRSGRAWLAGCLSAWLVVAGDVQSSRANPNRLAFCHRNWLADVTPLSLSSSITRRSYE